jgi:RNA polymerase sigma factor for flagellar operon FliA
MGPEPDDPAHDVGDIEVGRDSDHHEVGPVDGGHAHEVPAGPGLGHDVDPAGGQGRGYAASDQRELVRDDCAIAPVSTRIVRHSGLPAVVICSDYKWREARPRKAVESFNPQANQAETPQAPKFASDMIHTKWTPANKTPLGGTAVKPAIKADIDIERATYEDDLVRRHLPLVQYVVSEVAHRVPSHVSRSDLVSAGMLGLAQAARNYDPERGIAFDRFASTRIRGALLDELRGRDWASRSVRARARGLQTAHEELMNKLGRTPTPEEVATMLDVPTETVHKLVDDVHRATVLNYDSLVMEGDAESFIAGNDAGPEEAILDRERKAYLVDAVHALPERLQRVVTGYFFEERSMQDLADELGVSESRISQLRAEALLLLKDGINSQLEPDAVQPEARPNGRVARRKAAYYSAVATGSSPRDRVSERPMTTSQMVGISNA